MKKNKILILVFIVTLIFSFSKINTIFGVDPDLPQWQVGNWWKLNIEISGEVNSVGTTTYTIVGNNVDIVQNGQNYNCYQINAIGTGTIFGDIDGTRIGGTWTLTERHYYTKSEQSWVGFYSTYEDTISVNDNSGITPISTVQDEFSSKTILDITFNPPFEANKGYPLTVGESWSAATIETIKKETTINGDTESSTENEAYSKTFLVLQKETITIAIGETDAYIIKRTDPDGAYAEIFYSPEVGFDVKQIEYDSTGTIQTSMELLSYEYQSIGDNSNLLATGKFTIIVMVLVISAIVAIYILKKKMKSQNDVVMRKLLR
ncbi:hypothetical protein ACFLRN_01880 [Thermoproteota archaeon]